MMFLLGEDEFTFQLDVYAKTQRRKPRKETELLI